MMFSRGNTLIVILALLVAVIGGYAQRRLQHPPATDSALVGQSAPPLNLNDLEGKAHTLSSYAGRRVVFNFWASWCVPCLQEMPALTRAQKKFGEKGPIVVGIAMDDAEHVRRFLAAHPVNYPILLGQLSPPSTTLAWGDEHEILPYSVLVDTDGRILATHVGVLNDAQLNQWLQPGKSPR